MTKIASIATELDGLGLKKEASTMDVILIKLAQDYKCLECKRSLTRSLTKLPRKVRHFVAMNAEKKIKKRKRKTKRM